MGWRGEDVEAAWQAESGLNLLTFAAFMDDMAAVNELLAGPQEEVAQLLDGKGTKMVIPGVSKKGPLHRREPLGIKLCTYAEGMSPLMAAMTFARPEVVTRLIDAGANVERDGLLLLGERPCTFRGAAIAGKADNVRALLSRFPQYVNSTNEFGACPLHFGSWSSQCLGQASVIKALIEHGAKPSIHERHLIVGSPLTAACGTYDQDPDAIRMLLDAGADPGNPEAYTGMHKFLKTLSGIFRALGNTQMRGMNNLFKAHAGKNKWSPVHVAAARGDIATVRLLTEHGKLDPQALKDAKGRTPVELCEQKTAPCQDVPMLMQRAIEEVVTVAAAPSYSTTTAAKRGGSAMVGVSPPQVLPPAKS
jgi:ankyrin repeat protein